MYRVHEIFQNPARLTSVDETGSVSSFVSPAVADGLPLPSKRLLCYHAPLAGDGHLEESFPSWHWHSLSTIDRHLTVSISRNCRIPDDFVTTKAQQQGDHA